MSTYTTRNILENLKLAVDALTTNTSAKSPKDIEMFDASLFAQVATAMRAVSTKHTHDVGFFDKSVTTLTTEEITELKKMYAGILKEYAIKMKVPGTVIAQVYHNAVNDHMIKVEEKNTLVAAAA